MNRFLIIATIASAVAALIHLGCIIFGASWYRFFGAGEQMAQMAEKGSWQPAIMTSIIVAVLVTWSLYAASGAGLITKLPFLPWVLSAITAVYLLRGVLGFFLINNPIGRTPEFWLWSSAICLTFGIIHLIGLTQVWKNI